MKHNQRRSTSKLLAVAAIAAVCLCSVSTVCAQEAHSEETSLPSSPSYVAMTKQDRWNDYLVTNFAQPGAFFQTFFTALGDQTGNVLPEWGTGDSVFAKHLASQFARFTIGGTLKSSVGAVLGEDTRFHSCTCRGALARTSYAISRTFVTYDRNGKTTPNIANLAGLYSGPMVMTTWYPRRYTAWGYGVRQGNLALGISTGINLIREFSPGIKGMFHHKRSPENPDLSASRSNGAVRRSIPVERNSDLSGRPSNTILPLTSDFGILFNEAKNP